MSDTAIKQRQRSAKAERGIEMLAVYIKSMAWIIKAADAKGVPPLKIILDLLPKELKGREKKR